MVEAQRHLVLANRDDRRLLDISSDEDDRPVADLGIEGTLGRVLTSGNRAEDELHLAGERLMVVNQMPCGTIADERRRPGTLLMLRDHTEVAGLADQLGAVRSLADSLRAQAHKAPTGSTRGDSGVTLSLSVVAREA